MVVNNFGKCSDKHILKEACKKWPFQQLLELPNTSSVALLASTKVLSSILLLQEDQGMYDTDTQIFCTMPLIKLVWYITATSYLYTLFYIQRIQNKKTKNFIRSVRHELEHEIQLADTKCVEFLHHHHHTAWWSFSFKAFRAGLSLFFSFIWFPQLWPHEACWSNNMAFANSPHKCAAIL